jgi:hypothetical protein
LSVPLSDIQDSVIDIYLSLVRSGVVVDDDLTLAFGLGVSAHWKYGQFPVPHLKSSNEMILQMC